MRWGASTAIARRLFTCGRTASRGRQELRETAAKDALAVRLYDGAVAHDDAVEVPRENSFERPLQRGRVLHQQLREARDSEARVRLVQLHEDPAQRFPLKERLRHVE